VIYNNFRLAQLKQKFPPPNQFWQPDKWKAWYAGKDRAFAERDRLKGIQTVSTNQALQNQNLSVTPAGDVLDLTTGLVIRRATPLEMATLDEEADTSDNTKLILIVVAVAVVGILLFWKK